MLLRFVYLVLVLLGLLNMSCYWRGEICTWALEDKANTWLLLGTFLFSFMTAGVTVWHRISFILITALLASGAIFFGNFLGLVAAVIYVGLLTGLLMWLKASYPRYALSFLLINLFGLLPLALSSENAPDKAYAVFISGLIVSFFYLLIAPFFAKSERKEATLSALKALKQLNQDIFACFIDANYPDNVYLYERRLHVQKERFLKSWEWLSHIAMKEKEAIKKIVNQFNLLYDIMMDYAALRYRVTDYTIFAVCKTEMLVIASEISDEFDRAMLVVEKKSSLKQMFHLLEKLKPLEDTYQNVMQVTAREPLVFILFFSSLKHFAEEIERLSTLISREEK